MINQFRDEFRFLSNFWPAEIVWEGRKFKSVEHAFVFSKTDNPDVQIVTYDACEVLTAGQIKQFGKLITLREGWSELRVPIMKELVRLKFQIPELKEKLLATDHELLFEGNTWGDKFWGVDLKTGKGANHLGIILMEVREELANENLKNKT